MFKQIQAARHGFALDITKACEAYTGGLRNGELLRLTGPAIPLDKVSGNGRKYIAESVHMQVAELQPRIQQKALFGCLDHPPTDDINQLAYVKMTDVSHRIDALWLDKKTNTYFITITILDTPNGRIMKAIYDAGSPLFVSLRSLLDPARNVPGNGFVNAWMLALITIDCVSRPGFADAELKAVDVSTEAAMAVCESLNLFSHKSHIDMKVSQKRKQRTSYIPAISMESFAGVATEPSKEFRGVVTEFIADVLDKLPGSFTVADFAKQYPDSMFNGHVVGLYEDTKELLINDSATKTVALIELESTTDGVFTLSDKADVQYFSSEVASQSDNVNTAVEKYAIVATEGYEPDAEFIGKMNEIVAKLREDYSDGFTAETFGKDIVEDILDEHECSASLDVDDDEACIKVTCPAKQNGATIELSKDGDKFKVEQITEYWLPEAADEAYEVGKVVNLTDASGDTIASGKVQDFGIYGERKADIEKEDADGYQNMLDASIGDDTEVVKIDDCWYFIEDGMAIVDITEPANEAFEVGQVIDVIETSDEGDDVIASGEVQACGTVGELEDDIRKDAVAAKLLDNEDIAPETTAVKIDGNWYLQTENITFKNSAAPANEALEVGNNVTVKEGDDIIAEGELEEVSTVGDIRDRLIEEDTDAAEFIRDNDVDDATPAYKVAGAWYFVVDGTAVEGCNENLDGFTSQTDGNQPDALPLDKNYIRKTDLKQGDNVQATIVDDEDDEDKANKTAATQQMYQIVEDSMASIVDEDDDDDKKPSQKHDDDDKDPDKQDHDDANRNELAEEAQRIFNMPNSKFAGIKAIESMPAAFKHIWAGLSDAAKNVIAQQAKTASIATEAQILQFWTNTNFVAVERACLVTKGKVEAAMENLKPLDPRTSFLMGN